MILLTWYKLYLVVTSQYKPVLFYVSPVCSLNPSSQIILVSVRRVLNHNHLQTNIKEKSTM